ncbi:MAG: trigger factor [Ancrocorticia sp.]|nr:trigger factor [Ancrocorticia sp.]MCI1933095.1 trigger factor [Ancrocorticia sp.]MCI1963320.1 trigger factor [Ancrocorticia sp.]MCI2002831.1 trigger factor [Ancrocorticia sp.]MCI2013203.1 trigger factor [Ancrocorticia sp.]
MKSSVENLEPTKVKVTVAVPFEEFQPAIDRAAKEIAKKVQVPGFRKGHVPARVLEAQFGRGAIVEQAINDSLDGYYADVMAASKLVPLARPEVNITNAPVERGDTSDLAFDINVTVRPAIVLPDPAGITLKVDSVSVSDDDVEERLTSLRERFGTLKTVDRPAADGDYVTLDMEAKIGDEEIDSVTGVSYQIGSGTMLPGMDEALVGMSAGETKTYQDTLAGGEHEGEDADVTLTVENVKISELPEADDDFAQMASEFDTIDELRDDLRQQVGKDKAKNRVYEARDMLLEELRKATDFPLPQDVVDSEVAHHLEQEGKESDDPHGQEIRSEIEDQMRDQLLLDVLAEAFGTEATQDELLNFLIEQAQTYGMDPNQFIQAAVQSNQLGAFAGELTRGKALLSALRLAKLVDADGTEIDVAEVVGEAPESEKTPDFAALNEEAKARIAATPAAAEEPRADAEGEESTPAEEKTAADEDKDAAEQPFDPANAKVDEVLAYVANVDDAERARVLEAEKAGKARKSLIAKLEA